MRATLEFQTFLAPSDDDPSPDIHTLMDKAAAVPPQHGAFVNELDWV
jgi:hypothetical protein